MLDAATRARFVPLTVKQVVPETSDAVSVVLDVPPDRADLFAYRPGQFVTVRVDVEGAPHVRSYSMSSAPGIDPDLQVTVKRVAGGVVSNWLHDHLVEGEELQVTPPAGAFVVDDVDRDVVAFAAGSGITPVFSILKSLLGGGTARASLLYANRDTSSVIFGEEIDRLADHHAERFRLAHHVDADRGFVTAAQVAEVVGDTDPEAYVCGPLGFIDTVESALLDRGIDGPRIHVERFSPVETVAGGVGPTACEVTIRLGGRKETVRHRRGTTLLQAARSAGLRAPSSCETGTCATCMARVTDGEVRMRNNEVLSPDEVAEGWALTCQAEPVTPSVEVVYE